MAALSKGTLWRRRWLLTTYLMAPLLRNAAFGVALFSILWLAPDTLFDLVQALVSGQITLAESLKLLLYHLPGVLQQAIPMASVLSSVFVFRRLSQDFELTGFFSAGISPWQLLGPLLVAGGCLAGLQVLSQEVWVPWAAPRLEQLAVAKKLDPPAERSLVFLDKSLTARENTAILKQFVLLGQLNNASPQAPASAGEFVALNYNPPNAQTAENGVTLGQIVRAQGARWDAPHQQWLLQKGTLYTLNEAGVFKTETPFKTLPFKTSPAVAALLPFASQDPATLSTHDMRTYVRLLQSSHQNQDVHFFSVRLAQRFSMPVATAVLLLLGAFLGQEKPRSKSTLGLSLTAVVLFMYLLATPVATHLGLLGLLNPVLAAWLPLALASGVAWGLLKLKPTLGG